MKHFDSIENLAKHIRATNVNMVANLAKCVCGETYDNKDGNLHCWRCNPPE